MNTNNKLDKISDLIVLAESTGISNSEVYFWDSIDKLAMRWDERLFNWLLQKCITSDNLPSLINNIFIAPTTQDYESVRGNFVMGKVIDTDIEVGLSKIGMTQHTLIAGATGFGKTNCLNVLADEIIKESRVLQWFIDPKNAMFDFRWLAKNHQNVAIIPLTELRLNPFAPIHNVPRSAIMEKSIEILGDSFGVLDASQGIIAEHVEKAFEREEIPCFKEVAKSILSEKTKTFGRKQGFLDSLEVRIKSTLMSLGEVFNCREDYFDKLYDKNSVFENGCISFYSQRTITQLIVMKLSLFKTYNSTNYLSNTLAFEEAQGAVFSKHIEQRPRTSAVASLATQARAYGLGLVVLVQNPYTKLLTEMLGNTSNIIAFHLGGTEVKGMMDCMGLTLEQAEMLQHIPPGEAIFKTNFGYTEPLHIKINYIDNTPPLDEEVERLMRPVWDELHSHVTIPSETKKHIIPEIKEEIPANKTSSEKNNLDDSTINENSNLKPDDIIFLKDIQSRPYEFTENRYTNGTLTRNRAIRAKERLIRLNYLDEIKLKIGKRGKPPSVLRFTEKANDYLNISNTRGKGSLEHQWWQHFIFHIAKQNGLKAKIEDMQADVSISNGKTIVAMEITFHTSNLITNIERSLSNGFNEVLIGVNNPMYKKVKEQILNIDNDKIKVFVLNDIILHIKSLCDNNN